MIKRASIVVAAFAAVSLAGLVPAAQAALRVGENYRLASDSSPFRGKDAAALAVDPGNPQHIVEVDANYLSQECEYTVSRNGGSTWSAAITFKTPAPAAGEQPFLSTCGRGNHLSDHAFQSVAFGSGQNVYTAFAVPRAIAGAPERESGMSVLVAKSANGGRTFAPAVVAIAGGSAQSSPSSASYELPSVGVDPRRGSAGTDRVIVAAHETTDVGPEPGGDAAVAVSDNGARSFSPTPVRAETAGEDTADAPSPPVVRPDHSIAVAYRTKGSAGLIKVATGTVAGQTVTFAPAATAARVTNTGSTSTAASPNPFDGPGPFPSTGSSFPRMAVDKGSGRLYLVYNQGAAAPTAPPGGFAGADHFISPDSDVYLQSSATGAQWSQPRLINNAGKKPGHESPYQPPAAGVVTQTRHPDVSVAPNGRVDIVWEDRRHWYRGCVHTHLPCNEARLGDTYYAYSNDHGKTFSKNKRISDRSHNNDVGYDYRYGTGWAFGPVMAHMGNSRLLVAWMDAREGDTENDNQDIYLAKVDHAGPAAVPQDSIARSKDLADTSVRLSRHTYPGGGEGLLTGTFASRRGTKVVIANRDDAGAVLAAGVLARANLSQVLLSPPAGLPASVKAEVTRMAPAGAYLVGNSAALSDQVIQDLKSAGVPNPERLDGTNGSAVAAAIARNLDRRTQRQKDAGTPAFNAVAIVNPGSPDASAVSALASARRLPVLFANRDSIPQETKDAITALGVNEALIVGGPGVVSDAAVGQLPGAVTAKTRLGGADQYATSRAVVAESLRRGLPDNMAYVADGSKPIDGALLGSTVGRVTGLLMLSPAPLRSTAARTARANRLSRRLDRLILLQPGCVNSARVKVIGRTNSGGRVLQGSNGNDRICGTSLGDVISGNGGRDVITGGGGDDRINGGSGSDRINGGSGKDRISGSSGNDRISGSSGNDRINGNSGSDRINGNSGNDRITGASGNDVISGSTGKDIISGSSGNDRLSGNSGNDRINGNSGSDRISGGSGRDRISGGPGKDRIKQ